MVDDGECHACLRNQANPRGQLLVTLKRRPATTSRNPSTVKRRTKTDVDDLVTRE